MRPEILRRLRARAGTSLGFALLGMGIACATRVPDWLPFLNDFSLSHPMPGWWKELPVLFAGATLFIATLRAFMGRAAELTQRPHKFAALLLLAVTVATLCMHLILPLLKHGRLGVPPLEEALNTWWQTLLWGGLVGWLYVLSLQRLEDQEQLDALQLRRALLARELARTRLGAARAQIDPAMVARVLREVHRRYRGRPDAAALLLDRLISYLRLAMQRVQRATPSIAAETELLHAVVALHEAEHGIAIAYSLNLAPMGSRTLVRPWLPVVRTLLDAAVPAGAQSLRLDCGVHAEGLRVALSLHGAGLGGAERGGLGAALGLLLPDVPDPLQYLIEPGVHTYVVHLALR